MKKKMSSKSFDKLFESRLRFIKNAIVKLKPSRASHCAQLSFLKSLSQKGYLSIKYHPKKQPPGLRGDSALFDFSMIDGIAFSKTFRQAWTQMAYNTRMSRQELSDALDNFILHELFHVGQELTSDLHGDIRNAQAVLRVIDYQADANAAIAAFYLYYQNPKRSLKEWRNIYARIFKAIIKQMFVFDYPHKDAPKPSSRITRHFVWHYHFHRVSQYREDAHFKELQLILEPGVSLRNIASSPKDISKNWPEIEPSNKAREKPHLWLTAPNDFGVARVYRFLSTKPDTYSKLFEGIFEANVEKTKPFFRELLDKHRELLSRDDPTRNNDPSHGRSSVAKPAARRRGRRAVTNRSQNLPRIDRLALNKSISRPNKHLSVVANFEGTNATSTTKFGR